MTGHRVSLPNFRIDKKTGKPVKLQKLDASARIRQKSSKRVRVAKKGSPP
jgi:hypothetical protein